MLGSNTGQNLQSRRLHLRSTVDRAWMWCIQINFWHQIGCASCVGITLFCCRCCSGSICQCTCKASRNVWRPNIQGEINPLSGKNPYTHGAFQLGNSYLNDDRSSGSAAGSTQLTFSATRSSTIYSGNTLQPKALQVLACIRTWCKVTPEGRETELYPRCKSNLISMLWGHSRRFPQRHHVRGLRSNRYL